MPKAHFRSLGVRYVRIAEDTIARYYADALLNGLKFDRHGEELAVATFARSLQQAAEEFTSDPLGLPLIPNWNRVVAAIPEFFELLRMAVVADNRWVYGSRGDEMQEIGVPAEAVQAANDIAPG